MMSSTTNGASLTPEWAKVEPQTRRRAARPPEQIEWYGVEEIAKPLPPPSFLVDGLRIGPGAPLLLAGPSFVGKTTIAMSMMLAMAAGKDVWSVHGCKPASVLHIDLEQGRVLTNKKYQRLARSMNLDLLSLEDRLRVAIKPRIRLDAPHAEDVYARAFDGRAFVLIDCLRAAAPRANENDSDVRQWIDLVDRIAEKTGSVVAFVHHMKKPSQNDAEPNARNAIRGSSAIFDACGGVFTFTGAKNKPARVSHEKERTTGQLIGDFGLAIEDVEIDGDPKAGLRVRHLEPEQLDAAENDDPRLVQSVERLRAHFRANPIHTGNKKALRAIVGMKAEMFSAAMSVLLGGGEVEEEDGPRLRWIGGPR